MLRIINSVARFSNKETFHAQRYTAFSSCSHCCGDHYYRLFLTLYLLNESQEHLVLSRLHPTPTLVPGYVLKEFGTSQLDWSC